MSTDAVWHLKARALLLPSPYAALDPAGEPARQDAIERWLEAAGVTVEPRDKELLERCARDAHDAHVPVDDLRAGPPCLRHPLSTQPIASDLQAPALDAFRRELLDRLPVRSAGEATQEWYCRLWWTLMSEDMKLASVPASLHLPDHSVAAHRCMTAALAGASSSGEGRPALLYLHVGPVQSFISAARRTHDLWIGSFTVSFLTFAAVRALVARLGPDAIVYPDLASLPLAARLIFKQESTPECLLRSSIPNKFLAVVPEQRAEELVKEAAKAVADTWTRAGKGARRLLAEAAQQAGRDKEWDPGKWSWDEQMADHLELDAVVQPWPEERSELHELFASAGIATPWWLREEAGAVQTRRTGPAYGTLFDLTHRALAAHRRALEPPTGKGDCRPKCTSCGIREQMCPVAEKPASQQRASREFFIELSQAIQALNGKDAVRLSLQLPSGEGLCAVCMTKRFAPQAFYGAGRDGADLGVEWRNRDARALLRFPSVASVASAPLRFHLKKHEHTAEVQDWLGRLEKLHARNRLNFEPPGNLLAGLGALGPASPLLSVDGTWFYESAYEFDVPGRLADGRASRAGWRATAPR